MAVLPPDPVFCLKGDMGYIHSLCFQPTTSSVGVGDQNSFTSTLLAATENGFVFFWDLETNRLKHKQKAGNSIQSLHCHDGKIITQEKEGLVKLWGARDGGADYELLKTYSHGGGYCRGLLIEDKLILPQENSTVDVVDVNSMRLLKNFRPEMTAKLGSVMCLQKVELSGNVYILAGFESGDIILWDFVSGAACSRLRLRECITSLTFDPVTCRGICGNASNILQVFTIDRNFNITLKCEITMTNEGCNVVKLRPDRKIFVSGGWDGRLRLFSWKSLRLLVVLTEHKGSVTDIQFSPSMVHLWNSNIMAASGADGVISLWNLYN